MHVQTNAPMKITTTTKQIAFAFEYNDKRIQWWLKMHQHILWIRTLNAIDSHTYICIYSEMKYAWKKARETAVRETNKKKSDRVFVYRIFIDFSRCLLFFFFFVALKIFLSASYLLIFFVCRNKNGYGRFVTQRNKFAIAFDGIKRCYWRRKITTTYYRAMLLRTSKLYRQIGDNLLEKLLNV